MFHLFGMIRDKGVIMNKGLFTPTLGVILIVSLFCISGYGYIQNIIHLISLTPFVFEAKSIIGIGGVFIPPVGIIMGLFVW